MPLIASAFRPPWILRNGHLQTILPVVFDRWTEPGFQRERLELPDGDFLDLDWLRSTMEPPAGVPAGGRKLAILSHGLEGHSRDAYMRSAAAGFRDAGWDVLSWNYRGCSGEMNRLARFYHSGETNDLGHVIARAARDHDAIGLVGFSLGGNLILKYLGEFPPHPAIFGAVAVSAPVDLASSALALDRNPANRFYLRRLIDSLIRKVEAKARIFPDIIDACGAAKIHGFAEFDDRYSARLHGFADAEDYWTRCSSRPLLPSIAVPALLLNARDDPFLTPESFPADEARASRTFCLESPGSGGHLGFVDSWRIHPGYAVGRAVRFLEELEIK